MQNIGSLEPSQFPAIPIKTDQEQQICNSAQNANLTDQQQQIPETMQNTGSIDHNVSSV
jgi:hypothetical protein